jgi:hypothetical protein
LQACQKNYKLPEELLQSQGFNNKEFIGGVKTWLSSCAAYFFDTGIQKLIPRYEKCLNSSGDYVEK